MKKTLFLKVLSCLLILCLLSGCKPQSPLLAHADDNLFDCTEVGLTLNKFFSIENAEGKRIRRLIGTDNFLEKYSDSDEAFYEIGGDMKYKSPQNVFSSVCLRVPFSKSFTVHSIYDDFFKDKEISAKNEEWLKELGEKYHSESHVSFYSNTYTTHQYVYGSWSRVVHHCNNVVEIYGDLSEFSYSIVVENNFPEVEPTLKEDVYDLNGSGGDYVIIALIDGEILTEGMEGNYTVSHYHRVNNNITTTEMEYDENGNLLSTTEE